MKKILVIVVCSLFVFASCDDEKTACSRPPYSAAFEVKLDNFSDDIILDINQGDIFDQEFDAVQSSMRFRIVDGALIGCGKLPPTPTYNLTLTSATAFPDYPSGYKVSIHLEEGWGKVDEILVNNRKIEFTEIRDPTWFGWSFTIAN